jgi:hypothetical protein
MVAGCLAFAVLSLALIGGAIFALVVALSGSPPGPSVAPSTTHPAGAANGSRPGTGGASPGGEAGTGASTTTTAVPNPSAPTTPPTTVLTVPTTVPTTLAPLGGASTTMPAAGTGGSGSGNPVLGAQAGAPCPSNQVGDTVSLPDGSLLACEALGPTSQWVPIIA